MKILLFLTLTSLALNAEGRAAEVAKLGDYSELAPNTWTLVHVEDDSGGKWGARVIHAPQTDRLYLRVLLFRYDPKTVSYK
jgi:hypothetical protein